MIGIQKDSLMALLPRARGEAPVPKAKAATDAFESAAQAALIQLPAVLQDAASWIEGLLGTHHELDDFVSGTSDFRDTLATLRSTSPDDPAYQAAAQHLFDAYGYTPETAPKPGTMWTAPRLAGDHLSNGQVTAANYPTGTGVTNAPNAMDVVFAYGHVPTLVRDDGSEVTVHTPDEYRSVVADARRRAGLTQPDGSPPNGDPVRVHLTLEGGGGLGKRYGPAFNEMYELGIVPASVSGTSVGAIAAGYIAAGADPKTVNALASDPNLARFFDPGLSGSGVMQGKFMYQYVDQKLRELTGVQGREVTFADLKIPLEIPATILDDSAPPPGVDYSKPQSREFVFSQETTPNTPIVDAMLASGAFPGVLPTVDIADPVTGRKLVLTDSGVVDMLPTRMHAKDGLPEVGLSLVGPQMDDPNDAPNHEQEKALPSGDVDTSTALSTGLNALDMWKSSGAETKAFDKRSNPDAGQFMLALPTFDLDDARVTDKTLVFPYKPDVDPILDRQSRSIAHDFFSRILNNLGDPTARATNLNPRVPQQVQFDAAFEMDGHSYRAQYTAGDSVHFDRDDGQSFDVNLGQEAIQSMYMDNIDFRGSLQGELKLALDGYYNPLHRIERGLPILGDLDLPF